MSFADYSSMAKPDDPAANDYSAQYAPILRRYRKSQIMVAGLWLMVFLAPYFGIIDFAKGWDQALLAFTLAWILYSYFTVRCRNAAGLCWSAAAILRTISVFIATARPS